MKNEHLQVCVVVDQEAYMLHQHTDTEVLNDLALQYRNNKEAWGKIPSIDSHFAPFIIVVDLNNPTHAMYVNKDENVEVYNLPYQKDGVPKVVKGIKMDKDAVLQVANWTS